MLKSVILTVSMMGGSGNATFGSESVTTFQSLPDCKVAMRVFQASKGEQFDVVNGTNSVKFTQRTKWSQPNKFYELECIPLGTGE